jgi:hypothetical protein
MGNDLNGKGEDQGLELGNINIYSFVAEGRVGKM